MSQFAFVEDAKNIVPVWLIQCDQWADWLSRQDPSVGAWANAMSFEPTAGKRLIVPSCKGQIMCIVVMVKDSGPDQWTLATMTDLPPGTYGLAQKYEPSLATSMMIGWAMATYRFDTFKSCNTPNVQFVMPVQAKMDEVTATAEAISMGRTLINLPANHMSPTDLELAAQRLAGLFKAKVDVTTGDQLIEENFPLIHAVGRAAEVPPRLIDMKWGRTKAPKITLVGKGVCFDTGGLNLKPGRSMQLMRKDMGGAAAVLALAHMIMAQGLDVRLRVLVPAVENNVSSNSFRPGDILTSRLGKTVAIGNTDAEGRLILADALAFADEDSPDLIIDMATLTGAARVALGTELPAVFTNSDNLATELYAHAVRVDDPMWRLPLWENYRTRLDCPDADINNISSGPYGGSITAALFLEIFVTRAAEWVHIDTFGWNDMARPGRPVGGEVLCVRALFALLATRYGKYS